MSPAVPSAFAFSEKMTGRPRIVIGGMSEPGWFGPPIHTGPPPVPTDSAMVASSGNVSGAQIQTALRTEEGSIREYMPTTFSHTIVLVACPACAETLTAAAQLMKPCGCPV